MEVELATAIIAITALTAVVGLRSISGGRIEITLNDTIIAVIAAVLVLLVTGKLTKLVVSKDSITIETTREAILTSASRPITEQVKLLPVMPLEQAHKGGTGEIPEMIRRKVQALDLVFGFGGYDPQMLRTYLETLTRYEFFRFVVLQGSDRKLLGVVDARTLLAYLQDPV